MDVSGYARSQTLGKVSWVPASKHWIFLFVLFYFRLIFFIIIIFKADSGESNEANVHMDAELELPDCVTHRR